MTSKTSIPPHVSPLVRDLFRLVKASSLTQLEIETVAGVGPGTISHWRQEHNPTLINIEACFNALGYELRAMPKGPTYIAGPLSRCYWWRRNDNPI